MHSEREFLASQSADRGISRRVLAHDLRNDAEDLVADEAPETIVDLLEMVQVHQQQAQRRGRSSRTEFLIEHGAETAAIVEAGQAVVDRQINQLFVIVRLHARAGEELNRVVTDADLVAIAQFRARDRLTV